MAQNRVLVGHGRTMLPAPGSLWEQHAARNGEQMAARLEFMSEDHHRVRNFAVMELPRLGLPLTPFSFAQALELPEERVVAIVDELEKEMIFLYRSQGDAVTWAYPVTVDPTPHHVTISTGEEVYAA